MKSEPFLVDLEKVDEIRILKNFDALIFLFDFIELVQIIGFDEEIEFDMGVFVELIEGVLALLTLNDCFIHWLKLFIIVCL